jgi:HAD superfamily hydrolase (TIGR01662 family)
LTAGAADAADAGLLMPLVQQLGWTFLAHSPLGGREKSAAVANHKVLRPIHAGLVAELGDAAPDPWGLVLAWLGTLSPALVPLFGATRAETVVANTGAVARGLPAGVVAAMDKAFPALAGLRARAPVAEVQDEAQARALALARVDAVPVGGDGVTLTVGIQGAGKSSAIQPFLDAGAKRLNRDTLGGKLDDMIPLLNQHLASAAPGQRAAMLDNTYPTARSRAPVIAAARAAGVPVRAIWLDTPVEEACINVIGRMIELTGGLQGPDELKQLQKQHANLIPPVALSQFMGVFEPPTLLEGFDAVERRPFVRRKRPGTTKGLLLDVDGTLRVTRSGEKYPMSADDFEVLPGRREVLERWVAAGWKLFLVSNQSGIASGKVAQAVVAEAFANTVAALGVPVVDVAFCPHAAFPVGCFCRKPLPGMGVLLQHRHGLDSDHLVMVGDLGSDAGFAAAIGARFFSAEVFFAGAGVVPDGC